MAAAEVKTATLYSVLAGAVGSVAADYSMLAAGAIIGAAVAVSFGPKLPTTWKSIEHFLVSALLACGCAAMFGIPLAKAAELATVSFLGMDSQQLLFSVSGLIGLFWRDVIPLIPILGKRYANQKLPPPTDGGA